MPVSSPFDTPLQPSQPVIPSVVVTPPSHNPSPTPAFAIKMESDNDMQAMTTTTVQTVDIPRRK